MNLNGGGKLDSKLRRLSLLRLGRSLLMNSGVGNVSARSRLPGFNWSLVSIEEQQEK